MAELPEEEEGGGAPEWIVTFSDMISLLVTFFVMLMSFSTMEKRQEMVVVGAFEKPKRGVIETVKRPDAVPPPAKDRMSSVHPVRGARNPHSRPDEALTENLEEMGQKPTDEHLAMDFSQMADGLQLGFDQRGNFAPGSAEVSPMLRKSLAELGRIMQHYGHLVVVEGFTDSAFVPTPTYPTPEALSAARAAAAAQVMIEESGLTPSMVQIAGLGASRPLGKADTAVGRSKDRRVEVRIVALSKHRAAHLLEGYDGGGGR